MSTMKSAQTVYYGPSSTTYPSAGSVSKGEAITALWTESIWCYIEYSVTGSSNKKRGYVPTNTINLTESVSAPSSSNPGTRYIQKVCSTYFGPGTSGYAVADAMYYAMEVKYMGVKDSTNQYAFIEYSSNGTNKKRAWIYANNLAIGNPAPPPTGFKTFKEGAYIPTGYPLAGAYVSQGWNDKHTNNKGHLGYDLTGITYAKPLFAGKVVKINTELNESSWNGKYVCIEHTVNGVTFYTAYCHLASVLVEENKEVNLDTNLGKVGNTTATGSSMGTHLHVCVFTGGMASPSGYCSDLSGLFHPKTCEEVSTSFISEAKGYYYGPDINKYPRCGSRCFYDPYGIVSSNAKVIEKYHP